MTPPARTKAAAMTELADRARQLARELDTLADALDAGGNTAQAGSPPTRAARKTASARTATPRRAPRTKATAPGQALALRGIRQHALIKQRRLRSMTGMTASQIADALDISAPEAHGLAGTLTAKGWLEQVSGATPKRWRTRR